MMCMKRTATSFLSKRSSPPYLTTVFWEQTQPAFVSAVSFDVEHPRLRAHVIMGRHPVRETGYSRGVMRQ